MKKENSTRVNTEDRETCISHIAGDNHCIISSSEVAMVRRIHKICIEQADDCKIEEYDIEDKNIVAEIPFKYIKLVLPRKISEEERIKRRERAKNNFKQ